MSHLAFHCPLVYQPYPQRDERLNYGIIVFMPAGGVRVHIADSLRKIKAFHPAVDMNSLRENESTIPRLVADMDIQQAINTLNAIRVLRGVEKRDLGQFLYQNEASYMSTVRLLLNVECDPVRTTAMQREIKSRLFYDVRKSFRVMGILGLTKTDPNDHRVFEGYAPDPLADIRLDFALENKGLYVAQTIDLRGDSHASVTAQHKNTAYSKAFALSYTKRTLAKASLTSYIIVAGAHSKEGERVVTALDKEADHIYDWGSKADMDTFFGQWAKYAGKPLPSIPYN